jgi:hypothetical protein
VGTHVQPAVSRTTVQHTNKARKQLRFILGPHLKPYLTLWVLADFDSKESREADPLVPCPFKLLWAA